ncbi:tetratricopeptide repeat protein [Nocardia sp. NPDC057668]|uniref:serine/threonine-protein kinase n=1 Tax=Nocardia sp. NPDC057668 TaxID=3346202 RepID=UPI0036718C03
MSRRGAQPAWATRRRTTSLETATPQHISEPRDVGTAVFGADDAVSGPQSTRTRPTPRRLADGLLPMPQVSAIAPDTALLINPEVPEHKRLCWNCQHRVGRSSDSTPAATTGHCGRCGSEFNFRPPLATGDTVAAQYEVQGCLAHGGLGWIYLAVDRNVSDRWVVLKGLQNPQDFEAHVVALAERQFLSEMTHPGIVKIYNFVRHGNDGYIVMEYVSGLSLKRIHDLAQPAQLPVAQAIAYVMEVLPALDYLHSFGLAYNDLKPDNIMVTDDEVKLIDLGAVAAMASYGSIYGTPGYMAPEITHTGPTIASDIYTVGQTLAALTLSMSHTDAHGVRSLPDPGSEPVLLQYPGLHRLLERALDIDPARRFSSAYAMHNQLAGVLRVILAEDTGREHPRATLEFGAHRGEFGITTLLSPLEGIRAGQPHTPLLSPSEVANALPVPLIDPEDPSHDLLAPLLYSQPNQALDTLRQDRVRVRDGTISPPWSYDHESTLVALRAHLELNDVHSAEAALATLDGASPDWRLPWYQGITALLEQDYHRAHEHFDVVYGCLPGEITAALAMAVSAELIVHHRSRADERDRWVTVAATFYRMVWRTNRSVVSAAFGLVRQLIVADELSEAVAILDEVPEASRHFAVAQISAALLLVSRPPTRLSLDDIHDAARRAGAHAADPRALPLRLLTVGAAIAWLESTACPPTATLFGVPLTTTGLRRELERSLRTLASTTTDRWHRYRIVDLANQIRPRTWW